MDRSDRNFAKNSTMRKEEASSTGLPFTSKSFYLDLRGFNGIRSLTENIQLLGGIVEAFLSKEISCVITNRLDSKREIINGNKTPCIRSPMCNPSLSSSHKSESPSEGGEKRLKLQITSRAAALLEKATKTEINGSSDVLQNARKWGVAVISLEKILVVVEKHKNKLQLRRNLKRKRASKEDLQPIKTTELKHPYLKIETTDKQFSPTYIEFPRWPAPSFLRDNSKNTANSAKLTKSKEVTNQAKEGFCEICSSSFTQMLKHTQSARHRQAVERNKGFSRFDKLISNSHNLDTYLSSIETDFERFEEMRCFSPVSEMSDMEPLNLCTTESVIRDNNSEGYDFTSNRLNDAATLYINNKPHDVEIDVSTRAVIEDAMISMEFDQFLDTVLVNNNNNEDTNSAIELHRNNIDFSANVLDLTTGHVTETFADENIHDMKTFFENSYGLQF